MLRNYSIFEKFVFRGQEKIVKFVLSIKNYKSFSIYL